MERRASAGMADFGTERIDWKSWLGERLPAPPEDWLACERAERLQDLEELAWLIDSARDKLTLFARMYPERRFEQGLRDVFGQELEALEARRRQYERDPLACDLDAYLAMKYELRLLHKQLGAVVEGSDWQSPGKRLGHNGGQSAELGFAQSEENTYERSYGSDAVKSYEARALYAWYGIDDALGRQSLGFMTTSGMKALELALFACKGATDDLPFYCQEGLYGEGAELAKLILPQTEELGPEALYARLKQEQPIGGLLVDPGCSWPVRPAVELDRLMQLICAHHQSEPLYVIVDRTFTSIANPIFTRYVDRLPPHVTLICIESAIKYLQYGLDLANAGFLTAAGARMRDEEERQRWIDLLALLDAGVAPLAVRQLPDPDEARLTTRLARINRNARLLVSFLEHQRLAGRISDYWTTVPRSADYLLKGEPWHGAVAYIRLPDVACEDEVQRRIDAFVRRAPEGSHFVSGGSFGFDTFRMNAVSGEQGAEAALRISVGREPMLQLLTKLRHIDRELLQ
ncbi:hypothetical protein PA598K_02787 [Paenibacillus sp. 598K]|uniref:hypothetical protein n=1 Tax=Paenibacillus sp. 598K TaxID=1117987 RepID=UPI000FF986D6|nr:hypothetical protein [Paenibacillus sp. 598K]GBF74443.1 hypothetical protein PA598K_02787 [Paenibacillus sp. 598K]